MKEDFDAVRENHLCEFSIFQDLSLDEIKELEQKCHYKAVAAGTVFYESEQSGALMFFIKSGRVKLYHLSAEGRIFTTAILETGDFFGDLMLGLGCYGCFAEAATDCQIYSMSLQNMKTYLLGDSRIAVRIVENLGRRLLEAEQRLADSVLKNIPARLSAVLLQTARRKRSTEVFLTHKELSQMLGTRRETITRILNELQHRKLIDLHRGRIVLLNVVSLEKISAV